MSGDTVTLNAAEPRLADDRDRWNRTMPFVLSILLVVAGCTSDPRPADLQARQVFEQLQPGVSVRVSGEDYSKVSAQGLTNIHRAQFVDGMATGCADMAGEFRPVGRHDGWVCYLPEQGLEGFAVLYTPDSIQLLRGVGPGDGLLRALQSYGYKR